MDTLKELQQEKHLLLEQLEHIRRAQQAVGERLALIEMRISDHPDYIPPTPPVLNFCAIDAAMLASLAKEGKYHVVKSTGTRRTDPLANVSRADIEEINNALMSMLEDAQAVSV